MTPPDPFGASSIYHRFGVRPVINAAGTKSRLGGARMAPEVVDAMLEATAHAVDMASLQAAASRVIAHHTGAEAGFVTSGAAAGMTLSAAAAIAGHDPARIGQLPDVCAMPHKIVIVRSHRNGYDHAWRAAGATLVEVGLDDRPAGAGVRGTEPWEIDAAIDEATVGVAYVANRRDDPPLAMVCEVAHARGVPVLVDAAAQLPPVENLRRFVEAGADLVAFSGGKALGGPANTGILCGRLDLIQAVALNQLDLDLDLDVYDLPRGLFPSGVPAGLPRHGIGRGFKLAKEQIVGLLVALERFASGAFAADDTARWSMAERIAKALDGAGDLTVTVERGYGAPRVVLQFASTPAARQFVRELSRGEPAIEVDPSDLRAGVVTIDSINLSASDGDHVVRRIVALREDL